MGPVEKNKMQTVTRKEKNHELVCITESFLIQCTDDNTIIWWKAVMFPQRPAAGAPPTVLSCADFFAGELEPMGPGHRQKVRATENISSLHTTIPLTGPSVICIAGHDKWEVPLAASRCTSPPSAKTQAGDRMFLPSGERLSYTETDRLMERIRGDVYWQWKEMKARMFAKLYKPQRSPMSRRHHKTPSIRRVFGLDSD